MTSPEYSNPSRFPMSSAEMHEMLHANRLALLRPMERRDIDLLGEYVPKEYRPRRDPTAMVVGAFTIREATIIREFHSRFFQVPAESVQVAACNMRSYFPQEWLTDAYDVLRHGEVDGNAVHEETWEEALKELTPTRSGYDFVYVRNPDLVLLDDWLSVFVRAIDATTSDGVVVTLIRKDDMWTFFRFLASLQDTFSEEPYLAQVTGIDDPDDDLGQHHFIAIFKGKQGDVASAL